MRNLSYLLLVFTLLLTSCGPQRQPVPPGEIPIPPPVSVQDEKYGHNVLSALNKEYPLDNDDARINLVRDIVDRLAEAATASQEIWHVYVFRADDVVNAAATRGNHLFVWTGLLKTVENEEELVTVLAHEFGHLLADHTTPTGSEVAAGSVSDIAGKVTSEVVVRQGSIGALAGLAELLVTQSLKAMLVNPESQRKELEADIIGIHLMAEAGYDPRAALDFWERIKDIPYFSGGPIGFLSSHPSSQERVDYIRRYMPGAVERYERKLGDGG